MFLTNVKRVTRLGFVNFWRNGSVTLGSVLIMTIALLVIAILLLSRAILGSTLAELQNKVDINVYFTTSAAEEEILAIQKRVEALPEVAEVIYSSREEELEKFRQRHEGDELTLQALDEIGGNPLGAALNIKARDPSQYEGIAAYLENIRSQSESGIIDKVNYSRNKEAIQALSRIIAASKKLGIAFTFFAAAISILITFNTIRLTIYMAREEISVMRLVGASSRYIRGPFIVTGLMYGLAATLLSLIILIPVTYWAGPHTQNLGTGINVFQYFFESIFSISGIILLSSFAIGSISSDLAVKKYLQI